jgi:YTH domain-containing family protein
MNPPSNLRRSGTLQATAPHARNATPPNTTESVEEDEYGYEVEDDGNYDDEYAEYMQQHGQGQQYAASPLGSAGWTPGNDWRTAANSGFSNNGGQNVAIDEVQRALSALEIASNNNNNLGQMYQAHQSIGNYQAGQSSHPPRFNPTHPPPPQVPGVRNGGNNGNNGNNGNGGRTLDVVTDLDGRKTPQAQSGGSNYMQQQQYPHQQDSRTPSSRGSWDQKDRMLGNRTSNPNLQYGYQHGGKGDSGSSVPNVPTIPQQFLQQQPRMTGASSFGQSGGGQQQQGSGTSQASGQTLVSPIDLPTLIATKGYNPANFDIRPQFVRRQSIAC